MQYFKTQIEEGLCLKSLIGLTYLKASRLYIPKCHLKQNPFAENYKHLQLAAYIVFAACFDFSLCLKICSKYSKITCY